MRKRIIDWFFTLQSQRGILGEKERRFYTYAYGLLLNKIAIYAIILPRVMTEYAHSRTAIDIHPGAIIGKGFFIDHGTGVVIGETTVIGKNVKMCQGVTLGALSTKDSQKLRYIKRHPTVEDDVTIYTGATILGGDTVIGKGSIIGANTWITQTIPQYALVKQYISDL